MGTEIRIFARAVWDDWKASMSGDASVILTILGSVIDSPVLRWGLWGVAACCVVFACYCVWLKEYQRAEALQRKLDEIDRARPRIVVDSVFTQEKPLMDKHSVSRENALFACVKFRNEPLCVGPLSVGKNVVASLSYYGNDGTKLALDVQGEWWDDAETFVDIIHSNRDLSLAEFKHGRPQTLAVAFRSLEDGACFGFCSHSRIQPGWRINELRLRQPECEVRVTMQGENVGKEIFTFCLRNPGLDKLFEISEKAKN